MGMRMLIVLLAFFFYGCGTGKKDNSNKVTDVSQTTAESESLFISEWQVSAGGKIVLPLPEGFSFNFAVDWGDDSESQVSSSEDPDATHVYERAGVYTVAISGLIEAWSFWRLSDSKDNLISVTNLGGVGWKNLFGAFSGCENLLSVSGGNISEVLDMGSMFDSAPLVAVDSSGWNTAQVTDMSYMFAGAASADPNVEAWNTAAVQDMSYMFADASSANPNVGNWNTSSVEQMAGMFYNASVANPNTGSWNTANVTDMSSMFVNASSANPEVSCWNTANVIDMSDMFYGARNATPDVSCWDVAKVSNMKNMFRDATAAVPNMSSWDFSSMQTMEGIFSGVALPVDTYSALLEQLVETSSREGVILDGGDSKYSLSATEARSSLIKRGWQISDGGVDKN